MQITSATFTSFRMFDSAVANHDNNNSFAHINHVLQYTYSARISPDMAPLFKILAGLLLLVSGVLAHPGHAVADEAAERTQIMKRSPKSPRECASTPQAREYYQSAIKRRHELADKLRTEHSLTDTTPMLSRLDFADYGSSHASRKEASSIEDTSKLFADSSSCILQPEVTAGPYYVDGELIRPSIADGQEGVPLWVDIHLIDASTCEPMQGVYIDFWHCNATGVNSGVSAEGNGSSDVDTSNLDATFGRGIQQTNEEGVVQFSTIFPGKPSIACRAATR